MRTKQLRSIHRPPPIRSPEFNEHLLQYLIAFAVDITPCSILIADKNINLWKYDCVRKENFNTLRELGYHAAINNPKWAQDDTGSCIDY